MKKRDLAVFAAVAASLLSAVFAASCGDDSASGGAGGAAHSTGTSSPTSTKATGTGTTGTNQTTGTNATTTTDAATTTTVNTVSATTAAGMFDCTPPDGTAPSLTLTNVISGLTMPVLVKAAPDNVDRLYVVQQEGQILVYENGQFLSEFIDVSAQIECCGEEGLLGLAFHPDYAQNGRFFLHISAQGSADETVLEYARSQADPLVADPDPVELVLQHPTAESNHNGGSIEFGSDGYLYITFGDGGGGGDPECDAQNPGNLWGKIMRLDVNATPTATGYPAAPGNPNGSKIYHLGLRNPWRMSFDACTGDIYIGDVGQGQWEEVDIAAAAQGALNFGWPHREGAHDYGVAACPPAANLTEPMAEYSHNSGCSITGGYVHRGAANPALRGHYLYGDYCSGTIWMLRYDSGQILSGPTDTGLDGGNISSFGQDGRGNVYVVDHGGSIDRIDPQ